MVEETKNSLAGGEKQGMSLESKGKIVMVLLYILVVVAGGLSTLQAPVNGQLKVHLTGDFTTATFISYFMSGILLFILAKIVRAPKFKLTVKGTRWWYWLGGCAGVLYVCGFTIATANLGSASATGALVLGQLVFGMIVDQFGLLGMPKRKISPQKIVGVVLVLGGALLVFNF